MCEKGMKVIFSMDKLSGLKSIDLDFYETASTERRGESISQRREDSEGRKVGVSSYQQGKTSFPSLGGSLYFVTFIDDSSRKV